ncbi:hypothetical protein DEFDS_P015 (plasmid) [Deferribacter desulfuricans SSM1]|uniref:Thioredoxin domain-containing protein n=1 Tax=Deferribacter desulfuricans (strain DSM 14783 / JCM 11476 / NBRC 101012 / SSM1) TaxID=639282 RepID=D3PEK1_DEFDS|nr:thioredoxin fold domain-containing protein [Deferribacter desulfuricans]BAI81643.1 hypothetical protein DEFDS_P015 [Deferribacter desulfuricans SSM1]
MILFTKLKFNKFLIILSLIIFIVSINIRTGFSNNDASIFGIGDNFYDEINLQVGLRGIKIPDITQELRGKPTVAVGVTTTCPFCREYVKTLSQLYPNYKGLINVMLCVVDFRNAKKYIDQYPEFVIFPASLTGFTRLTSVPYTVILDREGNVLAQYKGGLSGAYLKQILDYLVKNY